MLSKKEIKHITILGLFKEGQITEAQAMKQLNLPYTMTKRERDKYLTKLISTFKELEDNGKQKNDWKTGEDDCNFTEIKKGN